MTLVLGIHYFLWYGALTSIFGYEAVYARHYTNATTMLFGYLKLVHPFATVIVTPLVCSMADRRRSHRQYFATSLLFAMLALSSLALLPLILNVDLPREQQQHRAADLTSGDAIGNNTMASSSVKSDDTLGPEEDPHRELLTWAWIYYCIATLVYDLSIGVTTCLSDSFAVLQAEANHISFGRIIVWGTIGLATSALVLGFVNQASFLPRLMPGILFGTFLLTIDVLVVSLWPDKKAFLLDSIPKDAAKTLTGSSSSGHLDPSDYLPLNESARINLGPEVEMTHEGKAVKRITKSPVDMILNHVAKVDANAPETSLSSPMDLDNDVLMSSETGQQQEFSVKTIDSELTDSPIAGGSSTLDSGSKNRKESDPNSARSESTNKKPADAAKILENLTLKKPLEISRKQESKPSTDPLTTTSFRLQFKLFCLIINRRKTLIRYLVLFVLSGFFMSMHWNYFFLYLERIFYEKFELISALSMIGQSILGELPFFILSRKFIDNLGRSHTLSISVISIGLRFLLYRYLLPNASMYFIFVADCFQGPNYGLFYVVMTEIGLEYSYCDDDTIEKLAVRGEVDKNDKRQVDSLRLALRSTIQSVAFACYEGIGVGLGSLTGGWLVASYGFRSLWLWMAVAAIAVGLGNILIEFLWRESPGDGLRDAEALAERREFMEASREGALQKVASPRPLPTSARVPLAPFKFKQTVAAKLQSLAAAKKAATAGRAPGLAEAPAKGQIRTQVELPPGNASK